MDSSRKLNASLYRKTRKFLSSPGLFFRDYFNRKYPLVLNEIRCSIGEEAILIENDLNIERKIQVDLPIDVVFTWVNDKDPVWKEKFYYHQRHLHGDGTQYDFDPARYNNNNEIIFAINSVITFMPWVRRVFIVTDNQIPEALDVSEKVKVIDHRDIISKTLLPTFNSHVIEAHLHNIPGLAEHFIYFNDDVFVARPLPASHFFKGNGHASLFLADKSLRAMARKGINTPTLSASCKAVELLMARYGLAIDSPLVHTYVPLRKSMFTLAWKEYDDEIAAFTSSKFRTNNDLNLATFLVPWLAYIKGLATPQRDICHYFNIRSPAARTHYEALLKSKMNGSSPHSFCANDFSSSKNALANHHALLEKFLNSYYGNGKKKYV